MNLYANGIVLVVYDSFDVLQITVNDISILETCLMQGSSPKDYIFGSTTASTFYQCICKILLIII